MTTQALAMAKRELLRAMKLETRAAVAATTGRLALRAGGMKLGEYEELVAKFEKARRRTEKAYALLSAAAELAREDGLL